MARILAGLLLLVLLVGGLVALTVHDSLNAWLRARTHHTEQLHRLRMEREQLALAAERQRAASPTAQRMDLLVSYGWKGAAIVGFSLLAISGASWIRTRAKYLNYGGLPTYAQHLAEREATATTLAGYHQAAITAAAHAPVPERLTYSYAPRLSNTAPGLLPDPAPVPALPDAPTFAALLERGTIGQGQPLLLGYTTGGMLQGSWKALYSTAVAGVSGSGKTTTLRFLAAQAALHGAYFAVLDPHADAGVESLGGTLAPLAPAMLCDVAVTEQDMLAAVRLIKARLDRRLQGDADRAPLILAVDEYTHLMRSQIARPLTALIEAIAQGGRKVGIYAMLSGQIWTSERSGGSAVRDALASVYCHRLRRNQGRLLLSTDEARMAEDLAPGHALLVPTRGDTAVVTVPHTTGEDMEMIASQLPSLQGAARSVETAEPIDMPRTTVEPALNQENQGSAETQRAIIRRMHANQFSQNQIIEAVFGVKRGGSKAYQEARTIYLEALDRAS